MVKHAFIDLRVSLSTFKSEESSESTMDKTKESWQLSLIS